ncbi:M20 family metallopeptidase [Candidatus Bathyarchaeota archaeon]|nr:M20 family metallopeptidase [Candidatus Bathyarchaeota archaeon]
MSLQTRLLDEIDRLSGDLVETARDMIRIPSENPPGDEAAIADYVSELLAALGFDVEQVEPKPGRVNTLGALEGSGGGKNLLWNGHYDTVPIGNPEYWTVEPLGGQVKDGRVYGRGSGDMKGAIASAITAAKAVGNIGARLRGGFSLHAVADEEFFGRYGTKYLCENGYVKGVDMAVVGETSTRDGVIMARPAVRGRTLVNIHVKGRSAHSSRPEMGVNAVLKMSKVLTAIDETPFSFPKHELLPDPTIAPGTTIRGGTKDNIIPEDCEAVCDVRTVPGMDPEQVLRDIRAVVDGLAEGDPDLHASVTSPLSKPPSEIPVDHPLYRSAARATEAVAGYPLTPLGASGSNDTSYLTNIAGVPAIAFGPGGGNAHAPDEWADIEMLVDFAKIYGLMMLDICGADG